MGTRVIGKFLLNCHKVGREIARARQLRTQSRSLPLRAMNVWLSHNRSLAFGPFLRADQTQALTSLGADKGRPTAMTV